MTWKDEIKKYYAGYGEEMAEVSARSEAFQEELAEMIQDLIDDLQQAISGGKVGDSKLYRIFKKYNIKFNLLDFVNPEQVD